jgi:CheY-like chemotaxis protein
MVHITMTMTDDNFTIMLAEDDDNDVFFVRRALKTAEINNPLIVVTDGALAIEYLRGDGAYADRQQHPLPKLVLLDIKMPKRTGLEVLEWLRSNESEKLKRLPVIIMSSSNQQIDIDRAYELGVNAYLVKPRGFLELVEVMKKTTEFWRDTAAHPEV